MNYKCPKCKKVINMQIYIKNGSNPVRFWQQYDTMLFRCPHCHEHSLLKNYKLLKDKE